MPRSPRWVAEPRQMAGWWNTRRGFESSVLKVRITTDQSWVQWTYVDLPDVLGVNRNRWLFSVAQGVLGSESIAVRFSQPGAVRCSPQKPRLRFCSTGWQLRPFEKAQDSEKNRRYYNRTLDCEQRFFKGGFVNRPHDPMEEKRHVQQVPRVRSILDQRFS